MTGPGARFGVTAIKEGFIKKDQLLEAIGIQIEDELEGMEIRLIGSILYGMNYLTLEQINEVLNIMSKEG